jgi:hypothetical protein
VDIKELMVADKIIMSNFNIIEGYKGDIITKYTVIYCKPCPSENEAGGSGV